MRAIVAAALMACFLASGCYSTKSGLPDHIQTVAVPVFRNNTEYYGLESKLTRSIIAKLNLDPRIKVVNDGEDARIYGEIIDVEKRVLRETLKDDPVKLRLTITVKLYFHDKVQDVMLVDGVTIRSHHASSGTGEYDTRKGERRGDAETSALSELADEIVRNTIGMW